MGPGLGRPGEPGPACARAVGRTRADPTGQADPSRCRARGRVGGRGGGAPVGWADRRRSGRVDSAPTSLSVSSGAGPGRAASARWSNRCRTSSEPSPSSSLPSAWTPPRSTGPGTSSARSGTGARSPPRQRSRSGRGRGSSPDARVEGGARGGKRSAPAARGKRVDLVRRGSGRRRCRPSSHAGGRWLQVGSERGLLAEVTTTPRRRRRRPFGLIEGCRTTCRRPAAASGSPSASSCASSCACASGAS